MPKKVLTVDDSKTMRAIVKKQIQTLGFEALEAADGAEGLRVAVAEKPDLILLDVTMPVMDGKTALVKLRQQPETARIPVIMVTAEAHKQTVVEIIQAGVSDYIVKPFSEAVLGDKINKALKASAANGSVERVDVLLIDDKENHLTTLRSALQGEHDVHTATTAEQALHLLESAHPRLVLINFAMPDTIRLQIAEKLKPEPQPNRCKLVALCAKTSVDEVNRASQKGFAGVLLKPFTSDEARAAVNNILQTHTQFASLRGDALFLRYLNKEEIALFSLFRQFLQGWQQWLHAMAEGGHHKLVVDVAHAPALNVDDLRFFRELSTKAGEAGMRVVFVVGDPKSFELKRFWESQIAKSAPTWEEARRLLETT